MWDLPGSARRIFLDQGSIPCLLHWQADSLPLSHQTLCPVLFIGRTVAEALILWPLNVKSQLTGKDPDAGKDCRQKEKGAAEDEMFKCPHRLNGHEFEQTLGGSE